MLTVTQLAEAAVFSAKEKHCFKSAPLKVTFDLEYMFQDPMDIVGLLAGLVVCQPNHLMAFPESYCKTSMIVLSHLSR